MIRVLLIPSSDYLGHPFPQRHNQIFERIHDGKNFEVHVLRFNLFEKPRLKSRLVIHEVNDLKIKPTAPYYLFNTLRHVAEIRKIIKEESIDILVLSNLAAPFAYTLLDTISSMHVPIIFDLPDYFPTSGAGYMVNVKSVSGKFLVSSFDAMLHLILRRATVVTAASHALANYAEKAGATNVVYLPNGISEGFRHLHNGDDIRNKLGFEQNDTVVGYIGSIEFWLDMESLIKGLAMAKSHGLPVKFLLIGRGLHTRYQKFVGTWIKRHGLEKHTVWQDFIPHEKVPDYISAMDVGTIPFDIDNPTAYYAAPNKLWEYLSQLKTIIATPIPEILHNRKYVILALSPQDYAKSLLNLMENDEEVVKKIAEGRDKAMKMTWQKSANSLAPLLRIISRRRYKERKFKLFPRL
jgi:glycosyltransferase involved in cell wall biosynthesis